MRNFRNGPAMTRISNWRNRRTIARGRMPRWERVTAEVKSRTPVYRNRVNPAHGNPHKADARLHRTANQGLARMRQDRGLEVKPGMPRAERRYVRTNARAPGPGEGLRTPSPRSRGRSR